MKRNSKNTGLDITECFEDISKIVRSKFPVKGHKADDLVQNVCKKIVKLNKTSPYDSKKASVSHYVYIVASSVFKSDLRKEKRSPLRNAFSLNSKKEFDLDTLQQPEDVRGSSLLDLGGYISEFVDYVDNTLDEEDTIPRRILLLTSMGYTKKEISKILNITFYKVSKNRNRLKEMASSWSKRNVN